MRLGDLVRHLGGVDVVGDEVDVSEIHGCEEVWFDFMYCLWR